MKTRLADYFFNFFNTGKTPVLVADLNNQVIFKNLSFDETFGNSANIISDICSKKDQNLLHYKSSVYLVKIFNNQDLRLYLLEDNTERWIQQQHYLNRNETLIEAQNIGKFGLWELNIQSGSLSWSDEIYRIFGVDPQEFTASYETFLKFVHPEDRKNLEKAVKAAIDKKAPYYVEHRIRRKDGEVTYIVEHGKVYYENDIPLRMIGVCHDVTDRVN